MTKVKCECGSIYEGTSYRHDLKWCPGCGMSAIDQEQHYVRILGNCKVIE